MTDTDATTAGEAEPTEDTPAAETDDTAQDTPAAGEATDWEARYREAERTIGRQGAELAMWRRGDPPEGGDEADDEADDDEADDAPVAAAEGTPDEGVAALANDSWALAEARYGEQAVTAYEAAYRIYSRAQTPADVIAAFEAYHEMRSGGSKGAPAAADDKSAEGKARQSRRTAVEPKVDLNRADASPDLDELESQFEEAKAEGNLAKFVRATTTAAGFGRQSKR